MQGRGHALAGWPRSRHTPFLPNSPAAQSFSTGATGSWESSPRAGGLGGERVGRGRCRRRGACRQPSGARPPGARDRGSLWPPGPPAAPEQTTRPRTPRGRPPSPGDPASFSLRGLTRALGRASAPHAAGELPSAKTGRPARPCARPEPAVTDRPGPPSQGRWHPGFSLGATKTGMGKEGVGGRRHVRKKNGEESQSQGRGRGDGRGARLSARREAGEERGFPGPAPRRWGARSLAPGQVQGEGARRLHMGHRGAARRDGVSRPPRTAARGTGGSEHGPECESGKPGRLSRKNRVTSSSRVWAPRTMGSSGKPTEAPERGCPGRRPPVPRGCLDLLQ